MSIFNSRSNIDNKAKKIKRFINQEKTIEKG